jgi:hypothetical protein
MEIQPTMAGITGKNTSFLNIELQGVIYRIKTRRFDHWPRGLLFFQFNSDNTICMTPCD